MKIKISVIPFILVVLLMTGLKLMSVFGLDSNGLFLGMNKMGITYAVIGLSLALFLVCVLINIFDKKTAPVYPVKKNPVSAVLAVLSGLAVAGSSIVSLLNSTVNSEYYLMTLICALLSIPAGIALIMMSKVHFSGKTTVSGISMLYVFPSLWGCAELVSEFLVATKVSISASDMTSLFCYIFITLYFFSHSMILSRIKGRNPVKACFIYGLPAIAISLAYGLYVIFTSLIEGIEITQILLGCEFIIVALYLISFIIEMTFNSLTKDEVEIIDGLPEDDDTYENSYVKSGGYDDLVFAEKNAESAPGVEPSEDYFSDAGLDDFVMGYDSEKDEEPIPYLTKQEMNKAESSQLVFFESDKNNGEKKSDIKFDDLVAEDEDDEKNNSNASSRIREDISIASDIKTKVQHPEENINSAAQRKSEPEKEPENQPVKKELSDIEKLLQELDNKK